MGYYTATGVIPTFIEEIEVRGLHLSREVFAEFRPSSNSNGRG
jgi:hypothetical protein